MPLVYQGPLYRPPSEAESLILQVTLGCSYNECSFCAMYRAKSFRKRPLAELEREIAEVAGIDRSVRRVFLADGDALVCSTRHLLDVLERLRAAFPELARVSTYASPQALRKKSTDELAELREAGLALHYLGCESGDDAVLERIAKGATSAELLELGLRVQEAGAKLSCMFLSGLGGRARWREHALASARLASALSPRYLSLLTVTPVPGTPLHEEWQRGEFELLDPVEITREMRCFVAALEPRQGIVFRANHASNYLPLGGTLPKDREAVLLALDAALADPDSAPFVPEEWRGL